MPAHKFISVALLVGAIGLAACDARYDSLAPRSNATDAGTGVPDAASTDLGSDDMASGVDLGGAEVVLARGVLAGRSGYNATGSVSLVRLSGGALELRFSDDFSAAGVPSPVALLTTRAEVTGGVQSGLGDISLGPMDSVLGAQAYSAPEAGSGALYAFVYCLPFTVEVARATLEPLP